MLLTVEGQTQPLAEWALDYGIPCWLIRSRLKRGWNEERAVTEPMPVYPGEELAADAMLDVPPKPRPIVSSPFMPLPASAPIIVPSRRKPRPYKVRLYAHHGIELSVKGWAKRLGISQQAMHVRLKTNIDTAFRPAPIGWARKRVL